MNYHESENADMGIILQDVILIPRKREEREREREQTDRQRKICLV